jgi:shikimate dehydrogenase
VTLKEKTDIHEASFVQWKGPYRVPAGTDVLINATSIGLYPDVRAELPLDLTTVTAEMVVADVIPNPPKTRLIRAAAEKGCRTIDGLGMLVNQGVIGIRLWTGRDPDPRVMRSALETVFGA